MKFLFGQSAGEFCARLLAAELQMCLKTPTGLVRSGDSMRKDIQLYAATTGLAANGHMMAVGESGGVFPFDADPAPRALPMRIG